MRQWGWDAVRRVHRPAGYIVIELAGWDMIVLPDRLWPRPADRENFIAGLGDKQAEILHPSRFSAREGRAAVTLVEPVLLARIALSLAAFQLILEVLISFDFTRDPALRIAGVIILLAGAAATWVASGRAFRWFSSRSPEKTIWAAWGVFTLVAAIFFAWCVRAI